MDVAPQKQSTLHQRIGIFGYSRELGRNGVDNPTHQIILVCRFVERELGLTEPLPDISGEDLDAWLHEKFADAIPRLNEPHWTTEGFHDLLCRAARVGDWNPYEAFAELLHVHSGKAAYQAAFRKLTQHGYGHLVDLLDLVPYFVDTHLPRALRSFDLARGAHKEEAFLAVVFYRFALKQAIADRIDRNNLEFFELPESFADHVTPEQLLLTDEKRRQIVRLREELENLPDRERTALKMYFGLPRGPERAQFEIARELGTTEYLARSAVVRGLQILAARLGIDGPLDAQEAKLLRLLLNDALPLRLAAEKLGLAPHAAKAMISRISRKFRIGLRIRTQRERANDE
jgi:DNA-directed RNA polymerase specialized sigma24 family protein